MLKSATIAAVSTAALLTACAGDLVSVVEPQPPVGNYYNGDFEYATRNGAIRTEISGKPFAAAQDALDARVRTLMKHQNRGTPADFVAADGERTDPAYKVVVVFNMKRGYSGEDVCRLGASKVPTTGAGQTTVTMITFCFGDDMKTWAEGRVNGVSGPDDPKFAALVRQTTLSLIPAHDGQDHGGDPSRP
jgi:hypothetical protein